MNKYKLIYINREDKTYGFKTYTVFGLMAGDHKDNKYERDFVLWQLIDVLQWTGLYDKTKWEELTEEERSRWTLDGNMPSEWRGKEIYNCDIVKDWDVGALGKIGIGECEIKDGYYDSVDVRIGVYIIWHDGGVSLWRVYDGKKENTELVGDIYNIPEGWNK